MGFSICTAAMIAVTSLLSPTRAEPVILQIRSPTDPETGRARDSCQCNLAPWVSPLFEESNVEFYRKGLLLRGLGSREAASNKRFKAFNSRRMLN
jgi:hypothetical protein